MGQLNLFGEVVKIPDEEIKDEKKAAVRLKKGEEDNGETELPNQKDKMVATSETFIPSGLTEPHLLEIQKPQNILSAYQSPLDEHKSTSNSLNQRVGVKQSKQKKEKLQAIKKEPQKRGRKSLKETNTNVDELNIPPDETLFQKQYYPLSVVAKWFSVTPSVLRYWEKEFSILKPRTNSKGDRRFRPEDVKNLQLIYHLIREKKYTMEGAKEYMGAHSGKENSQVFFVQTLEKFKSFLLDLKTNLQA